MDEAFAEAGGNTEQARAVYIKLRVAQLMETAKQENTRIQQIRSETKRKQFLANIRQIVFVFLACVCVLIAVMGIACVWIELTDQASKSVSAAIVAALFTIVFFCATFFCAKQAARK